MSSAHPPFDRAVALACTLGTLRGRWLYVQCACKASSVRPVRLMLAEEPRSAGRTLADVVVRLRCHTCRNRPASVHLTETPLPPDVVGDTVPGWSILLCGN